MDIERFFVTPVTVVSPGIAIDRYLNEQPDWDAATEVDEWGWLYQQSTSETVGGRDTSQSTWVLRLRPEAVVTEADRVLGDGQTFEVTGRPTLAMRPDGPHHLKVPLKLIAEVAPISPSSVASWLWDSGDALAWDSGDLIGTEG